MQSILGVTGVIVSTITSYMSDLVTFITGQPLLLLGVGLMLAGAAIGFLSRLIRTV